jgi:hypothetical protein
MCPQSPHTKRPRMAPTKAPAIEKGSQSILFEYQLQAVIRHRIFHAAAATRALNFKRNLQSCGKCPSWNAAVKEHAPNVEDTATIRRDGA